MKKVFFLILHIIFFNTRLLAQSYPNLNVNLLAYLDPETDNTAADARKYSGCWGWYQADKNREYAIVGTSKQTYFIDITNPSSPLLADSVIAKHTGCTWREIKTYQHYCYIVSDQCQPNSFQIVDMQYLPDSVHIVHDDNTIFEICHTIFIDKDNLYCGSVQNSAAMGSGYSTMRVYSLSTPTAPLLIRKLEQDISTNMIDVVHDMYVRNDTVYASAGYKGFHVLTLTSANTFSLLQSFTGYAYSGYNHSSWQTDDKKTMVFADEVPAGLPAKVIDVSDFNNITLLDTIRSHVGATAHNPYIVGNKWCWMSTYQDGLYLYDISNPSNTTIYGYFDTQPQHGVNDNFSTQPYRGNWGAYPFLPSKIIVACDMQNGIFILEGDDYYKNTVGVKEYSHKSSSFSIYPNPTNDYFNVLIANHNTENITCTINDMLGKIITEQYIYPNSDFYKTIVNTNYLEEGCYFISLKGSGYYETKKIVIQK